MPIDDFEGEGLKKNPNLEIAQLKFLLSTDQYKDDNSVKEKFMDAIRENDMLAYYTPVCEQLGWTVDKDLVEKMKANNEAKLKELDDTIADAEENLGEIEVRDAMTKKAEYLSQIGDKEGCLKQLQALSQKTLTLGYKMDMTFHQIRLGLFFWDKDLTTRMLDKAQSLMEEGGDWDRRNRLKVYQGIYAMSIRDFKQAATNFMETVATFTSYELMEYKQFVKYTVLSAMIAFERPKLRDKVVKGAEILEQLHSLPEIRRFLFSFYNCHYAQFFVALAEIEQMMKFDWLLSQHYRYYTREMRIMAYSQLLESYQSLTLDYMANAFGVTVDYMDQELSRFIAAGRLCCKIDKVNNIVETNRPDNRNFQYQATIKHGDILLNRVQKLSRIINL